VKGAVGAKPPKDFTLASILGYILDLFGISKENVYKRMELNPRIGPKKVAIIRKIESALTGALEWITVWIKEGPEGLLRKAKEKLSSIKDAVINSIVGWVTQKVSAEILKRLATSSDPLGIGATINTIILIYDTIKTAVAYINRMLNIANKAMDNLADIIAGNLDAAKAAFEEVLGKAVPVVVGFAVEVIIGPVADKIKDIVTDARNTVDEAIDDLINGALDMIGSLVDTAKEGVKKVLGWLGVTKEFKAVNGDDHELSFAGSEQNATLMIASGNPVSYEVWLEGVDATDSERAPALKIVKEMAQVEKKAETAGYTKEDKGKELRDLMDKLSDITGPLFAKVLPKTKAPKYEGRSGAGWGTGMEVDGLTKKGLEIGTTPSVGGGDFDTINKRRYGNGSYYILGHLLNMKLGGPGNTWDNLTPITRSANSNHESIAEARVKNAVDAGNIVKYSVTAEYNRPSNTKSLESAINASNITEDKDTVKEIIRAEANVPTRLLCTATMKNPKTNEETTLVPSGTVIENRLDQGPSDYSLTEGKRSDLYLDQASAEEINSIGKGMDLTLAKKIVQAYEDHGPFRTLDALTGYEVNGKAYFTSRQTGILEAAIDQPFVKLFKKS
jgi:DNA uptake protein ComE-like DNA-binding protein